MRKRKCFDDICFTIIGRKVYGKWITDSLHNHADM